MFEEVEESLLHHVCDLGGGHSTDASPLGESSIPIHGPRLLFFPLSLGPAYGRLARGPLGLGISSYLITLQRGSHQHHRPHGGYHIIWGNMFCLQNEQYYGPGTSLMPVWWG